MVRFMNNFKTVLLLGALMGLCVFVGSRFGPGGLVMGLMLGGLMNVVGWFFSDKIALAAMSAKEVNPGSGGIEAELYHMVDELRQRAGMPMPRVYICPQDAPNAFATGRSPSKAAVAVTQGALQLLSYEELKGVMAHELAHVKNRDTLISCVSAMIAGALSALAQFGILFGGGNNREGGHPIASLLILIFAPIGALLIQMMISRSREYVADADGAAIAGDARGLMSALRKLESMSRRVPMQNPNPAQNNLFIVEPFMGESLTNLFATHPPMQKRLASLEQVQLDLQARAAGRIV
ncbi:MAG: M48 family metalloprotease [Phycisphaerales bacterium]|jgi:heat shock protein HtpX